MAKSKSPRTNDTNDKQVITMPDAGSIPVKRNPTLGGSSPAAFTTPDLENKIRQRAYELYEQRGYIAGFELEDWFQAEREILGRNEKRQMQSA